MVEQKSQKSANNYLAFDKFENFAYLYKALIFDFFRGCVYMMPIKQ
jgi:hypothetical protein